MRRARARDARLAVVGLGLSWFLIGCGGGGVPDPASDSAAAGDSPPAAESPEAAPEARPPAKKADGEMLASNEARTDEAPPAEGSSDPAPRPATRRGQAVAPAETADPAPGAAPKGDATGTNELLNLANSAAPPPADAASKDEAAPSSSGSPGAFPGNGGQNPYGPPPGIGRGLNTTGPPGSPGPNPESMRPPAGMSVPGLPGGPPGGPGGLASDGVPGIPGGSSGGGPDDLKGPANFNSPRAAVNSFLIAVKAKDKDRLAEATALRSPQEASTERLKKLFSTIVDQSISDANLDLLAHDLQGYTIVGENQAKSSGRLGVVLQKSNNNGGFIRRTVTARKEAKGWKVVDIGGMMEQEGVRSLPLNRGGMPKRR